MGLFSRAADAASGTIDRVMAEAVRVLQVGADGRYLDPVEIEASPVTGLDAGLSPAGSSDVGQAWASRLGVDEMELDIDPRRWPIANDFRAGDVVILLERGNARFQINRRRTGERHRLVFLLTAS
jgi:hypothetical protein